MPDDAVGLVYEAWVLGGEVTCTHSGRWWLIFS